MQHLACHCTWPLWCKCNVCQTLRIRGEKLLTSARRSSRRLCSTDSFCSHKSSQLFCLRTVFQCLLELRSVADTWKLSSWLDAAIRPDTSGTLYKASVCARWHFVFKRVRVRPSKLAASLSRAAFTGTSKRLRVSLTCSKLSLENCNI